MPRSRVPWRLARAALVAVGDGATIRAAAASVGVSPRTVDNLIRDHGRMRLRNHKPRLNVLTLYDREEIRVGIDRGESNAVIGARIGRDRSTVWREIERNGGRDRYRAFQAHDRAAHQARRVRPCWVESRLEVWEVVVEGLNRRWSPRQIARRLRIDHPDDPSWWVSHESIYQAIFVQAKPQLRKELAKCLRSGRFKRKPQGRAVRKGAAISDMVMISERPSEAADRAIPGHWEGDLILGANAKSQVATLVERSTRMGMLIKVDSKKAEHVARRISEHVATLPRHLARSLTWDQGTELANHKQFTVETGIPVYFCDPASPWQRGSNENWNGLVRQFLPKGTDLSLHSQQDLDDIAAMINERPRQTLDWETPAERFEKLLVATTA